MSAPTHGGVRITRDVGPPGPGTEPRARRAPRPDDIAPRAEGPTQHVSPEGQARQVSPEGQARHVSPEGQARHVSADELEMIALFADGLPIDAIARRLELSDRTVRRRSRALCDRLGARATIQVVAWAARNRLI